MKISSIITAKTSRYTLLQQMPNSISNTLPISFTGEENDVFVHSNDKTRVKDLSESVPMILSNTLHEIEKRVDEINNLSTELPENYEDDDDMFEKFHFNKDGQKEFKIFAHKNHLGNFLKVISYNNDGSERAKATYLDGELKLFYIDPENNNIGFSFIADQGLRTGENKILKAKDSNETFEFGRYYKNMKENPYTYTRIECKKNDDRMKGSLFISKDENEIWWFDHSNLKGKKEDITFKPEEIKGLDMDKIFDEINSVTSKLLFKN